MSTGNPDIDTVLSVIGALTVILSVIANVPAVRASRAGEVLVRLTAVDLGGLLRVLLPLFTKRAESPKPPADPDAN